MTLKILGINKFERDLTGYVKDRLPEEVDTLQKKIVFDLLGKIVKRTPVGDPDFWQGPAPAGYVGGRARANWQVQVNVAEPHDRVVDGVDDNGAPTISRGEAEALTAKPFGITWIFNNVPYIIRLEDGWSRQTPPGGMIALSVEEVDKSFGG